jgi:hypothetical protein
MTQKMFSPLAALAVIAMTFLFTFLNLNDRCDGLHSQHGFPFTCVFVHDIMTMVDGRMELAKSYYWWAFPVDLIIALAAIFATGLITERIVSRKEHGQQTSAGDVAKSAAPEK